MKIAIIPKITEKYKSQIEYSIEKKLISYLKKIYIKSEIQILMDINSKYKFDILIISGGNDLPIHKKVNFNILRNKFNNFYFSRALKKNIPIIGICHGAQFIASKYSAKFKKTRSHVGIHKIFYGKSIKKIISHHNYKIQNISNNVKVLAVAEDKSIELFKVKTKRIYGFVWHPERQNKIDNFKKIFKNECN